MGIINFLAKFFHKYLYYPKWKCICCGKEIFDNQLFCDQCKDKLPFIVGSICNHCGRKTLQSETYCSTCKNIIISVDKCRSVFEYKGPIVKLILQSKYYGQKYLLKIFAKYLAEAYWKNYFNADFLCYVPMNKSAQKERGYNQSEILCRELSKIINVPTIDCLERKKKVKRQAQLDRKARLNNLKDVFSVKSRKSVKDKVILCIDDVTTTGATSQAIAEKLKQANAQKVYFLTIASVAPRDGY